MAIGYRPLEEFLEKTHTPEFQFVGATVHREGILRGISQKKPDILIIRENLDGKENILTIVHTVRAQFPEVRIVFLAGDRAAGDSLLANLVSYGIYDVLYGEKINAKDVIGVMRYPNDYARVRHLQPKPIFDEELNKILYEAPDALPGETIEHTTTVYVQADERPEPKRVEKEATAVFPAHETKKQEEPVEKLIEEVPEEVPEEIPKKEENASLPIRKKKEKEKIAKKSPEPIPEVKEETPKKEHEGEKTNPLLNKIWSLRGTLEDDKTMILGNKQKILTFVGAKEGVGTTTIAFNTAVELAKKHRVLYVEWNEILASTGYWYELGHLDKGIDSALMAILEEELPEVMNAVTRLKEEKKQPSDMQKVHKKFPDQLDCLYFSGSFMIKGKTSRESIAPINLAKDLYLYLLFQGSYDYVVLDVPSDTKYEPTIQAMTYAHKVFFVTTQDVAVLGQTIKAISGLTKVGIDLGLKGVFILNKYEKFELDEKRVKEWLEINSVVSFPNANKECLVDNYNGMPSILQSRSFMRAPIKSLLTHL